MQLLLSVEKQYVCIMCVYMGNTAELLILIHSTTTTRQANIFNSAHFFYFLSLVQEVDQQSVLMH